MKQGVVFFYINNGIRLGFRVGKIRPRLDRAVARFLGPIETAKCLFVLQDDPEIPFTETDFRRRKAHLNFKEHIAAEKLVTKLGKTVRDRHDSWTWIGLDWIRLD